MLMNPADNADNLPEQTLIELQGLSARAKLRFWWGQFGDATEGALWGYEQIEAHRVSEVKVSGVRPLSSEGVATG